jgi:NitT/TauT family transport system substrate-binding protein
MDVVTRKWARAAAASGLAALTLVSGCGSPRSTSGSSEAPKTNLVVAAVPVESSIPLYLAQERGIFAAHGLNVTIKPIISTSLVVPQMLNGTYDIVSGQVTTFIAGQAEGGGQFRVIAAGLQLTTSVDQLVALPTSNITDPGDLAGQTIAVNAATGNGELLTDAALSAYNITPGMVTFKVIPFAQMSAALSAHQVAVAYCANPYCTLMEQQIGAVQIADLNQGGNQGYLIGGFSTTDAWMKQHTRAAAEFSASISQANNLLNSSPTVADQAFQTGLGITPQLASLMAPGIFPSAVTPNQLTQVANLMIQFGELNPDVNVSATVNALLAAP